LGSRDTKADNHRNGGQHGIEEAGLHGMCLRGWIDDLDHFRGAWPEKNSVKALFLRTGRAF
jgi:hypothetical protein